MPPLLNLVISLGLAPPHGPTRASVLTRCNRVLCLADFAVHVVRDGIRQWCEYPASSPPRVPGRGLTQGGSITWKVLVSGTGLMWLRNDESGMSWA